jgi:aryl-alcohol dehydrogenase
MLISAAVWRRERERVQIESLELDAPRDNEVLVRIVAAGICHTDLFAPALFPLPAVFGHEGAGIVERVGRGVTKVKPGDRVAMTFGSCGHCRVCHEGQPAYCEHGHDLQFSGRRPDGTTTLHDAHGGPVHGSFFQQSSFATHALGSERSVVLLPDAMPLELAGPLGCGIQTGAGAVLNSLAAEAGSNIAIFGVGSVGLAAVMGARIAGCHRVIAVDVNVERLELAREFGATDVLDATLGDVVERIRGLVPRGVHYSLETAGHVQTMDDAINCLARRGTCALVTVPNLGAPFEWSPVNLLLGGRRLVAVLEGDSIPDVFIPRLAQFYLDGRLPVGRLTREYDFRDIGAALDDAHAARSIKPILRME